jgi:hypothetical protein
MFLPAKLTFGGKMGRILNPDKFWEISAGPLIGQKVPFQDQASSTITRGPSNNHRPKQEQNGSA